MLLYKFHIRGSYRARRTRAYPVLSAFSGIALRRLSGAFGLIADDARVAWPASAADGSGSIRRAISGETAKTECSGISRQCLRSIGSEAITMAR